MNEKEFNALKAQLTRATPKQLKNVHVVTSGLLKLAGHAVPNSEKAPPTQRENDDWLLDGIVRLLKRKGIPVNRSRSVAKSLAIYNKGRGPVIDWFTKYIPLTNPTERSVVSDVAARCLFRTLQLQNKERRVVTYADMLECVSYVPAAIDNYFPGYAEAGLLSLILRNARGNAVFGMTNDD